MWPKKMEGSTQEFSALKNRVDSVQQKLDNLQNMFAKVVRAHGQLEKMLQVANEVCYGHLKVMVT